MSATDYRKLIMYKNDARYVGVECTDGATVELVFSDLAGWAPRLTESEVNALIDALVEAKQVMRE